MPTSGTWESSNDAINADAYAGGWHKARVDILADGRASFLIDGSVLWTSTQAIDTRYLTGKRLILGSRSSGSAGKAYHDNIKVSAVSSRYSTVGSYPITDCVKDNTTGLTWEGKPTSGLRASSNEYTNYDSTTALQNCTGATCVAPTQSQIDAVTNSVGYKTVVNASALCGYTDWRLPTLTELQGLVLTGVGSPTIDASWFPNTQQRGYWSSTPSPSQADLAWSVNFNNGDTGYYNGGYDRDFLRLVRGQAAVSAGLIAYYPFDGNANDASGNGNDGVVTGTILTNDRFGNLNSAYSFNGIDDYIKVPNSRSISISGNYTLAAWVKFNQLTRTTYGYDWQSIINKDTFTSGSYALMVKTVGENIFGTGLTVNSWHYLTSVYDAGVAKTYFYLDGLLVNEQATSGLTANSFDLWIGKNNLSQGGYGWYPMDGQLDEIRIYNRALTHTEIQQLYLAK